jgi:hypothetical protein
MRDWTPREQGDIYCAPACGRGCTKAEHQRAVDGANKLCALLGTGWIPRVWENLGWYYTAKLEKAVGIYIEVYPRTGGDTQFWVDSRLPRQFYIDCNDPKEGIKAVLKEAQRAANEAVGAVGLFQEAPADLSMNRKYLEKACEEIDAAVFSGDTLWDDRDRTALSGYVGRWTRAIAQQETSDDEGEDAA